MKDEINYSDIMDLGFNEELIDDNNYFFNHGFQYAIITKDLTKKIYLDWSKETKLCKMVRIDNPKKCNIKAEMTIKDLNHLKEIIEFYTDEEKSFDYSQLA